MIQACHHRPGRLAGTVIPFAAFVIACAPVDRPASEIRGGFAPGQVVRDCPDCPELVVVPSGQFMMGAPQEESLRSVGARPQADDAENPEGPMRMVRIRTFALGRYDVTRAQWTSFVAARNHVVDGGCEWAGFPRNAAATARASWRNLGFAQSDDHPVVCVSWNDAQAYVRWLSARTGHAYRLPTEAEWEYAARAGTASAYPWGDEASHEHANYGADACCSEREMGRDRWSHTSPVGWFPPNGFGLFDMHGNAWQWVQDCYAPSYTAAPTDGSAYDESKCQRRVLRGGTWGDPPAFIRSAYRNWAPPPRWNPAWEYRSGGVGFRVARSLE